MTARLFAFATAVLLTFATFQQVAAIPAAPVASQPAAGQLA
ncbi:hypothetical protein [Erythrobacter sp. 3-20A1M]|nr:hypothetical protein [Erythrobacter sp. 3-20A1M]|tara:strand:- start:370 stop:492 length:123 start_codon:yes stop_codon:yes gene_type:complete